MALSVPLSRFTPRVGGGSAFFVRRHSDNHAQCRNIFYMVLAILFAFLMFRAAMGFLPRARPRVWPFRISGYKEVRLSRFSLVSVVFGCFGVVIAFASAAFSAQTLGLIGVFISIVGFVLVSVSRSRDIQRFLQQRLATLSS